MNFPDFLRNPGGSFEFATWLRKFIEDNLPVWVQPQKPAAPSTDAVRFNNANDALLLRYLHFVLTQADSDGYGIHINDDTGGLGSLYEAEQSILLRRQDGQVSVLIGDAFGGITLHSTDRVFVDAASFLIAAATSIDGGNNKAENFADGVASDDLATVGQIAGAVAAAIRFAVANVGTYLNVKTTGLNGASLAVQLHDTNAGGDGIQLQSDHASVTLQADNGYAVMQAGSTLLRVHAADGVLAALAAASALDVLDHLGAAVLSVDEATGVTTGTFDGGSP